MLPWSIITAVPEPSFFRLAINKINKIQILVKDFPVWFQLVEFGTFLISTRF